MSETISHDLPELRARFAVQDFLVDFLGGLVPGLLFLLGLVFSAFPVILLAFAALLGAPRVTFGNFVAQALEATRQTPNTIWIAGFFILITIAYVVGHLFYRRGPKTPDQESFKQITGRFLRDREKSRKKRGFAAQGGTTSEPAEEERTADGKLALAEKEELERREALKVE